MAISSSGAVSFANVQTEYGGSNPISLNEYYNGGSLVKANTSSTANSSTLAGASQTGGSGKSTYTESWRGWGHDNLFDSGQTFGNFTSPTTQTQTASISKITGADLSGNSGTIPSSGTIDMNKFRGTNAGTDGTFICAGIATQKQGSLGIGFFYLCLGGHLGTQVAYTGSSVNFNNIPFTTCNIPASGAFLASTANTSGANPTGSLTFRASQTHLTATNLGNYTVLTYGLTFNHLLSSSGSLSVTFNF
jgi:hypothetical protein